MHILYVSHYFPPEMGAPSARVHELSRAWVRAGEKVTVLTGFPHHPTGRKQPGDRFKLTRRESKDGIDVVRSYVWATANKGNLRRMLSFASFACSAVGVGAVRVSRPDLVLATSPQLLCGLTGYMLAKRFRVPFVFEVRDLWPEAVLANEAMPDNFIVRSLKRLARFLYHHCRQIVTVGEGYRAEIHERYQVPLDKMAVVPNGIDTSLFLPRTDRDVLRQTFGWSEKFVVLYLGTHGMSHSLHEVLAAAEILKQHPEIHFAFVGEGAEKEALQKSAVEKQLQNVVFIGQQTKEEVPKYYEACDLGLVSLRNTPLYTKVLPSKIFEYLGMAKPVLLNLSGEAQRLLEAAQAGLYVPPDNPQALADAVLQASRQREKLQQMGQAGRAYVLQNYDREVLAQRYLELLRTIVR